MMKLKYLFENFDLAREALTYWPHGEEALSESLTHFRISSNAIYPFFDLGGLCFLRLAPEEEKLKANILGELDFMRYLRENGFPAMEAIPSITGETLLTLTTRWGVWYACAFRCVPGTSIEDTPLTETILLEYGRTLGRLHTLSAQYVPTAEKWSYREALAWVREVLTAYAAPKAALAELNDVRAALDALPRTAQTFGMVHYDFEPDNVFWDEETQHCAVIDFDDGMLHFFSLDVEQALDALSDAADEEHLPWARDCFMRGYLQVRPFTPEQEATRPLMRRFIDLYGYARLLRSVAERFADEPEWLVGLRGKLQYSMDAKLSAMQARWGE